MRKRLDHDPRSLTRKREKARFSKAELARALGCSRSLVTEWEDGTRNAHEERIIEIANLLGCEPNELRARTKSRRSATATTDGAVSELQDTERTEPQDVPELRGGPVGERNAS